MRDYGVPSIAALLDRTREFEDHGVKRYDDTLLIGDEAVIDGIESPRGHAALRRLNRIHGHYDIPEHEFHYVLATTIVGPVRWIEAYGWRSLDPHELTAIALLTTRFGELMGLRGLPTTYDGYLHLLIDYERAHFAASPAGRRVTEATLRVGRETAPWPLKPFVRRLSVAMMDEPLRHALGCPRSRPGSSAACAAGSGSAAGCCAGHPRAGRRSGTVPRPTRTATASRTSARPRCSTRSTTRPPRRRRHESEPERERSSTTSTRPSATRSARSSTRRSSRGTSSGRPTASSTGTRGPRPARRVCSHSSSTRSTAAAARTTSATTWWSTRR